MATISRRVINEKKDRVIDLIKDNNGIILIITKDDEKISIELDNELIRILECFIRNQDEEI